MKATVFLGAVSAPVLVFQGVQGGPGIWERFALQVPGLVVVAWLVFQGIRYLDRREAKQIEVLDKLDARHGEVLEKIGQDCHDHSEKLTASVREALDRSTDMVGRNTEMLGKISGILQERD